MKAATKCIHEGKEISIEDAIGRRSRSNKPLYFTCIECGQPVRAHRAGENHSDAHFEHHERHPTCPHSDGQALSADTYDTDDKLAIEGYLQDRTILSGARNQALALQCKARDNYKCQACGFKLKLNGRYVVECHHTNPIRGGQVRETKLEDLISLCPTCHRIAHTRNEPLSLVEIRRVRKIF